jgi:hypothetical protein
VRLSFLSSPLDEIDPTLVRFCSKAKINFSAMSADATNQSSIYVFYAEEASVGIKTMRKCVTFSCAPFLFFPVDVPFSPQIHRHPGVAEDLARYPHLQDQHDPLSKQGSSPFPSAPPLPCLTTCTRTGHHRHVAAVLDRSVPGVGIARQHYSPHPRTETRGHDRGGEEAAVAAIVRLHSLSLLARFLLTCLFLSPFPAFLDLFRLILLPPIFPPPLPSTSFPPMRHAPLPTIFSPPISRNFPSLISKIPSSLFSSSPPFLSLLLPRLPTQPPPLRTLLTIPRLQQPPERHPTPPHPNHRPRRTLLRSEARSDRQDYEGE